MAAGWIWVIFMVNLDLTKIHNSATISDLEKCTQKVSDRLVTLEQIINNLKVENEQLKSEHYKDDELKQLSEELKQARDDLSRGFEISKEEFDAIHAWKVAHENEKHGGYPCYSGAIGGQYDYIFTPTSIGEICEIKCTCGETFRFREL